MVGHDLQLTSPFATLFHASISRENNVCFIFRRNFSDLSQGLVQLDGGVIPVIPAEVIKLALGSFLFPYSGGRHCKSSLHKPRKKYQALRSNQSFLYNYHLSAGYG
jgi:hypothetical protein